MKTLLMIAAAVLPLGAVAVGGTAAQADDGLFETFVSSENVEQTGAIAVAEAQPDGEPQEELELTQSEEEEEEGGTLEATPALEDHNSSSVTLAVGGGEHTP